MRTLVLGSSSAYRAELLTLLAIPFEQDSPSIDETMLTGEAAEDYVCRLAREKAKAVAVRHPNAIVIGSDQCSESQGQLLGKPHTPERAIEQLTNASGQIVTLFTAIAVLEPDSGRIQVAQVPTTVHFRTLSRESITRYVQNDSPLDCAGSFRAEGLGITLFERINSDDPTAVIGLPLIALTRLLAQAGINLP